MKHIAAAIAFVAVAFITLAIPAWMWIRPLLGVAALACIVHLVIVEARKGRDDLTEDDYDETEDDEDAPADDKTQTPA